MCDLSQVSKKNLNEHVPLRDLLTMIPAKIYYTDITIARALLSKIDADISNDFIME